VQWRVDGKLRSEWYAEQKDRDKRARELAGARKKGLLVDIPDREELTEWRAFKAAAAGVAWQDILAGYRANLKATGAEPCTITVAAAATKYLATQQARLDRREIDAATFRNKRHRIQEFAKGFGSQLLTQIRGEAIEQWIDDVKELENPHTVNDWRKHIGAFFEAFDREVPRNPIDDFKRRSDAAEEVKIRTVQETARLFAYALQHHPEAIGRLACEAFVGLRFSSAAKLVKGDINFADRSILLPARKVKTRRRFNISEMPETVWSWLPKTNDACWAMTEIEYRHLKSDLFTQAKVVHPKNCLRHGAATYHVAAFGDAGKTATMLCHHGQQMLWARYNGVAKREQARLYWTITPQTVDQLAAGAPVVPFGQQAG
jgi:integrase